MGDRSPCLEEDYTSCAGHASSPLPSDPSLQQWRLNSEVYRRILRIWTLQRSFSVIVVFPVTSILRLLINRVSFSLLPVFKSG